MAHIGLEAIEGQHDTTLRLGNTPETCRVLEGEGDQFVIALQEISDRPGRYGQTTLDQRLMDFRDTAMVCIAPSADEGEDIEAKLMFGQG